MRTRQYYFHGHGPLAHPERPIESLTQSNEGGQFSHVSCMVICDLLSSSVCVEFWYALQMKLKKKKMCPCAIRAPKFSFRNAPILPLNCLTFSADLQSSLTKSGHPTAGDSAAINSLQLTATPLSPRFWPLRPLTHATAATPFRLETSALELSLHPLFDV